MKRAALSIFALSLAAALSTSALQAQSKLTFGAGAGLTLPMGDFGDAAKLGWHGLALVGYSPSASPVGFRGEFFYGQNNTDGIDGSFKLAGAMASVTYDFPSKSSIRPYVLGGIGMVNAKVEIDGFGSDSETKLAAAGGGGIKFRAGSNANFFVEGRFVNVFTSGSSTTYIPVSFGIQFGSK